MSRGGGFQRNSDFRPPPPKPRIPRHLIVLALAAAAVLTAVFLLLKLITKEPPESKPSVLKPDKTTTAAGTTTPARPDPSAAPIGPGAAFGPIIETIPLGSTLSDILAKHGFSVVEANWFYEEVKPVFDLRKLVAGRSIRLYQNESGITQAFEYDITDRHYLRVDRQGRRFLPGILGYQFETRTAGLAGVIEDILISAVEKRGEKSVLAILMSDLFAWDIDFYTELRVGDTFRMIFEKNYREGEFAGYGQILAAEFICQGRRYEAFRFVYPDTGEGDHFDAGGKSVRKEFLRSPLPFARITSRFSASRLHPIHKVYRAHYGVDYGAPLGTPVQATADGVVLSAGWNGGAGRMIKLRHANSFETMYLHLNRILVKIGDRVKMGQDIATVGSTGESTGPHLDYRITQAGVYINPLGKRFDPVAPLRKEYQDSFGREITRLRKLLPAPAVSAR